MKVRETNVSDSDKRSARLFFDSLTRFWDLSQGTALDAFARNGQLTLPGYIGRTKDVHAWELSPEHEIALRMLGVDEIKIGCSYEQVAVRAPTDPKYDMVVIDTPQGAHKSSNGVTHFEHFDFFRLTLAKLLKDRGIVVLYVNKHPYDKSEVGSHGYDEYDEYDFKAWMAAREDFYQVPLGYGAALAEEVMIGAYRRVASAAGWSLGSLLQVPCFSDVPDREPYAFRLALELRRA